RCLVSKDEILDQMLEALHRRTLSSVRPPGPDAVRSTVLRRQRNRMTATAVAAVIAIGGALGTYLAVGARTGPPPAGPDGPGPGANPAGPDRAGAAQRRSRAELVGAVVDAVFLVVGERQPGPDAGRSAPERPDRADPDPQRRQVPGHVDGDRPQHRPHAV